MTEKLYLSVYTDEYKKTVLELINRMESHYGWKTKKYDNLIEVTVPENDISIFNLIFDIF